MRHGGFISTRAAVQYYTNYIRCSFLAALSQCLSLLITTSSNGGLSVNMPKQPADYGEKEIKELCEDSVQLLLKVWKEMGLSGMTDMRSTPCETDEEGHCLRDFARCVEIC